MATKTKKTRKQQRRQPLRAATGSAFIRREEVQRNHIIFLGALDRAIEFHRTNKNDPYHVGYAAVVAITEVRDAFKAYMC